jgi:alpha-glucosidase
LYRRYGVQAVKTGYVRKGHQYPRTLADGSIGNEWYGGQYMVNFHQQVVEAAARHELAVDEHEPIPDTGLRRTWPNLLSREGQRGQEYNAWGTPTNPPAHVTILPFTRMLAGPFDYTPGIFDIEHGKTDVNRRVQSTLAQQLALYVLIFSPVQMAADLPENYEAHLDAFQFIRDVPVDWEVTRTLASVIGEYAVVARRERAGSCWFLGAATNEDGRTLSVALDFLERGTRYEATMYLDADDADFRTNPTAYRIEHRTVTSGDVLSLKLAPGGGAAVRFTAVAQTPPRPLS